MALFAMSTLNYKFFSQQPILMFCHLFSKQKKKKKTPYFDVNHDVNPTVPKLVLEFNKLVDCLGGRIN